MFKKNACVMVLMLINAMAQASEMRLVHAAASGDHEDVIKLMEAGLDVGYQNGRSGTALHWAIQKGHFRCVEALLSKNPEEQVHQRNRYGHTPLHTAALYDRLTAVKLLLAIRFINPNLQDESGDTPLHIAAAHSRKAILRELVHDKRVNGCMQNFDNKLPIELIIDTIKRRNPSGYTQWQQQKQKGQQISFQGLLNLIPTVPDNQ